MPPVNIRLLPPGDKPNSTTVNGRNYNVARGSSQDVPYADAIELMANGWVSGVNADGGVSTTALRPTPLYRGMAYLDTTISAVVVWDGATWRNALTGASV